jgi:hypothetical protein
LSHLSRLRHHFEDELLAARPSLKLAAVHPAEAFERIQNPSASTGLGR